MLLSKVVYDTGKKNNDLGIQNVFTPIQEIENVTGFSFIKALPENCKEICVLFNPEFVEYFLNQDYIKNNNVKIVFGYDSNFDLTWVKRMERVYKYNVEYIDLTWFKSSNDIKELKKVMGQRKFDVVFSNPPYGDANDPSLDLKICEILFQLTNHMAIVQPAGWVDADKNFGKSKKYFPILGKYITDIYFFDAKQVMNVGLKNHAGLIFYNKNRKDNDIINITDTINHENYQVNSLFDVTKYGQAWKKYSINIFKNMLIKYDSVVNHIKYQTNNICNCKINRLHAGSPDSISFYSCINLKIKDHFIDDLVNVSNETGHYNYGIIECIDSTYRLNLINYFKTKIVRFIISFYKKNMDILETKVLRLVPWLDFTRSWNDKDLCKEFNISKELWQYIDKFIPDYYDDYKSGFETCRTVVKKVYDNPSEEMIAFCGKDIIDQLVNKEFNMCWHSEVPNGAYIHFEKDNKKYSFQKSMNNNLNKKSKYRDRVGYELYELF